MKQARLFLFVIAATLVVGILLHSLNKQPEPVEPQSDTTQVEAPLVDAQIEAPHVVAERLVQRMEPYETQTLGDAGPVSLKVTPLSGSSMNIKIHTPGFDASNMEEGLVLRLKEGQVNSDKDALSGPDLPAIVQTYPAVEGMRPVVRILNTDTVKHDGMDIAPRLTWHLDDETGEFFEGRLADSNIYGADALYPANIVDVQEIKARDSHVVRVAYRPLQYNPVDGSVTHHKAIDSVLEFVPIEEKSNVEFASSATVVADDCDCGGRITLEEDLLPPMNGDAGDFASRWSGAPSGACVKIRIREQGVYRLTRANLEAAGVARADLIGGNIRMYTRDREIPITVSTAGAFGASAYVEFYGEGLRSNYDHANAYWLGFGGPGAPARFNDSTHNVPNSTPISGAATVSSACRKYEIDPGTDGLWQANLNHVDAEFDGWIASQVINASGISLDYDWDIPNLESVDTTRFASLSVYWRSRAIALTENLSNVALGGTYQIGGPANPAGGFIGLADVKVGQGTTKFIRGRDFTINSTTGQLTILSTGTIPNGSALRVDYARVTHQMPIQNAATGVRLTQHDFPRPFNANAGTRVTTSFSPSLLTRTATGTKLRFTGVQGNFAFLDNAAFTFYSGLTAVANRLGFGGVSGARNYTVNNITSLAGTPYVLDITEPTNPKRLTGVTESGTSIRFGYNVNYNPCMYVTTQGAIRTVPAADIETVTLHNLADTRRQADYILIVPEQFEGNVSYDLLNYRGQDNLNVLIATAESVYNEFGYGIKDAQAIKQFLGYAYHHFQEPKPKYVLLAGDAFKDSTKDSTSAAEPWMDYIPSKYQRTSFLFTATDQWYAAVDGPDLAPDLAIGRLPVNDLGQFQNMINKMKTFESYGQPAWRRSVQLVADETDQSNGFLRTCPAGDYPRICQDYFMVQNELDSTMIPNTITVNKSYLQSNGGNVFTLNGQVQNAFNAGRFAINYIGHGSKGKWGLKNYSDAMFDSVDADALTNTRLPLVTIFTCLNGQFHNPDEAGVHSCVERMIWRPNQGAAGAIAPTGLAQTLAGRTLCLEFYNAIFNNRLAQGICDSTAPQGQQYQLTGFATSATDSARLGDCLLNGFNAVCYVLGEQEELKFYHLFMDPATKHGF